MDYREFAAKVKSKYPDYSDMDDLELAQKMVAKYPDDYADVTFDAPTGGAAEVGPVGAAASLAKGFARAVAPGFVENFSEAMGGDIRAERKIAGGIGAAGKAFTEATTSPDSAARTVAEFALPQDELGGQAALFGGPIGKMAVGSVVSGGRIGGRAISEGAKNLLRYAESKGLKLTAADITGSRAIASIENFLEKTPLGSEAVKKFRDKQVAAIRGMRDALIDKFGTREDAEVLGQIAKDSVASMSKAMREQSDILYSRVGQLAEGKQIGLGRSAEAAMDLVEKELRLRPELRNQKIFQMASDVLGIDPKAITEDTLPFIRERAADFTADYANWNGTRRLLGDIIDTEDAARALGTPGVKFLSSAEAGAAKRLYKAAGEDLAAFSAKEGGELKAAHQAASSFYKEGIETFNDKAVKALLRSNPERIVDVVFRPGSVMPIRAVRKAAGEGGFQALKKQFVEKLLPEVGENLNPQTFQNALDKYGEATLREVFTPQELMQFRGLAKASAAAGKAAGLAGTQGSARTNTILASGGVAGGLIVSNPVTGVPGAVGIILGPKAVAELYLSDKGRQLLLDGFRISAGGEKAAKTAGAIIGYLSAKGLLPKDEK